MKRFSILFLVMIMVFGFMQVGQALEPGKLVVYTTVSDAVVSVLIKEFENETGIKVDLITAGAGELLKRVEAERENPQGDILWGAAMASITAIDSSIFSPYVSIHNDDLYEAYRNVDGLLTSYALATRCLLVNKNLIGDIEIKGYSSLLNEKLKGQIAAVDPSASSSGYGHLVNQLYVMGDGDPESGWAYVKEFVKNLDGKLLNSSSSVWKGVVDGEYTVGLTYEEVAMAAVRDGAPVEIVFVEEGVYIDPTCVAIIEGGANKENAQIFIDFLMSKQAQDMFTGLNLRGTRMDLEFSDILKDTGLIKQAEIDSMHASEMKVAWLEMFKEIFTDVE